MMPSYEDALQQTLESLRRGEPLDAAVARFPEHTDALREDVRLSQTVARLAEAAPSPEPAARAAASRRMRSELAAQRTAASRPSRWSFGNLGFARYAIAAVLVVAAVLGAGLVLDRGGTTVEAATIEGVVVENDGDMLTVQTLDRLEHVSVPRDTLVSDVAGARIGLDGIEVGQVVVVEVKRDGRDVVAQRIERYRESLEAWCTDDSARCEALTASLERAQQQCERSALECRVAIEHLEQLRQRAMDTTRIEQLKRDCRDGVEGACREVVVFCRDHVEVCARSLPLDNPGTELGPLRERIGNLTRRCLGGDDAACRLLAVACVQYPALCPDVRPSGGASPTPTTRPATAPDVAPPLRTPAPASTLVQQDRPAATSTPQPARETATATPVARDAGAAATPVRDVAATATPEPPVSPSGRDAATETPATVEATAVPAGDGPRTDR